VAVNGIGANVGEKDLDRQSQAQERREREFRCANSRPRFGDREKCVGVDTDFPRGWWWWIPLAFWYGFSVREIAAVRCGAAGGGVSFGQTVFGM
jgi:hypothetical protein